MKCVVCTLFEHHYHFGVAVFVNSLCKAGYSGPVYAGFRGPLPPWAKNTAKLLPDGNSELQVSPEVRIIFVPLKTAAHLTNYKPDFMLQVETLAGGDSDGVIYCDPDIVVDIDWKYIEEWITCGLAVCEDVNSPLPENHPTRVGWRRFFKSHGFDLQFRTLKFILFKLNLPIYDNQKAPSLHLNHRDEIPIFPIKTNQIQTLILKFVFVGLI